jgi:hypothetical protein
MDMSGPRQKDKGKKEGRQRLAPAWLATCCSQPANWGFADVSFALPSWSLASSVCFPLLSFAAKPAAARDAVAAAARDAVAARVAARVAAAAGTAADAAAAATEAVAETVAAGADVAEVGLVAPRFLRPNAPECRCVCA